ncbi:MAG TPA: MBL fold metallo-hydrolase [Gaiellaceae bacterium]|nr:MBL fold metallo-hydrolase [Gaiellaceae bacterium]
MRLTLIRHATIVVELGGLRLLVEPMLDPPGARPPVEDSPNARPNPLVPLPMPAEEIVAGLDAAIVTHLHRDHFDETGARLLPRDIPVFCQPEDAEHLRGLGLDARPVADELVWDGLRIARTGGRHGSDDATVSELAPVSGFVLDGLYIAGDTVWCSAVEEAIERHRPRVAVVNGSGARFLTGGPLVMTAEQVGEVVERVPTVVVVHLEAINHCLETRAELRAVVPDALVPEDGETLELG